MERCIVRVDLNLTPEGEVIDATITTSLRGRDKTRTLDLDEAHAFMLWHISVMLRHVGDDAHNN